MLADVAGFAEVVGFFAGLLIVAAWLPQLFRTWTTKSAKDLSLWTLLIILAGSVLWLAYGIMIENMPVIATNTASITIVTALVWMKVKYN
ncbi:MAG: SemiSWEET family transporter [Candidatus Diapherotrites archaeon]